MRRPTEARLRKAFADVLGAVVATAAGAAVLSAGAGCGGGTEGFVGPGGGGGGTNPEFSSLCAAMQGSSSLLKTMHVTPEIDGAIYRTESAFISNASYQGGGVVGTGSNVDGDAWTASEGESTGAVCSKATDPAACLARVHGFRVLPPTREACKAQYAGYPYQGRECTVSYILYTRGDEVGVARNNDEIKALLGTFDTLSEAMWVATNAGYQQQCSNYPQGLPESQFRTTQDGGYDLSLLQYENCGKTTFEVLVHVDYAGNLVEVSREDLNQKPPCAVAGRRPAGLLLEAKSACGPVGGHFAAMSTLEAASVVAFRRLHAELAAFDAPRALLDRVRRAARDEIRHARATAKLARKYGAEPAAPCVDARERPATLFEIALENAREGCVRETYGAMIAHLQAARAGDAEVRACMRAIADEETEHAALSWDIAAWIESQLGEDERDVVARERRAAFEDLARELEAAVDARLAHASGLPSAALAVRLLEGLGEALLAA
jgi:rubrerythrin